MATMTNDYCVDTEKANENDFLFFEADERIPDEMLKRFIEFQFKQWVKNRYKSGKALGWQNEDISDALCMGLHIEPTKENNAIINAIAVK